MSVLSISQVPLLILAGGKATRLKNLSQNTPKYLMPVGENETFADVHLKWAFDQGYRQIYLSVGHLAEQVIEFCGDGKKYGLNITYLHDGPIPLGTGGAVRLALQFPFSVLAVTYGDTLLKLSSAQILENFASSTAQAVMTVYENHVPGHVCNIELKDSWVHYDKAHPEPHWKYIDYGFLMLRRSFIESFSPQSPLDLAVPLSAASKQQKVLGFQTQERFWEIGSPEALKDFQDHFHQRKP